MAGWQALGPFGGAVAIVQVDPHHSDTVLAATNNALLFKSTNAGVQWDALPFPAQLHGVLHALVLDPNQPDTYLVGVSGDAQVNTGLFRTTDAGATWTLVPGLAGKEVWSIAIWPQDSKVIVVGTHGGVYLTRDGGETWKLASDTSNREMDVVVSLAFDPADSNTIYAGTPHLPWKTSNGGVTWYSVHTGMLDDSDVFSINVDRVQPQRVFASACSGIYNSVNGAKSWTKLTGARGASYRTYFVSQDPRHRETVFAGTTHGLVRSTDGGQTWQQLSTHLTRYVSFDLREERRIFVATDDDGIERSDDEGQTLTAVNQGFCNRHLPSLTVAGGALYTNTVYETDNGGIFRLDVGRGWEQVAPASRLLGQQVLALVPDGADPAHLYAAAYSSVLVSADSGKNWASVPTAFGKSRVTALLGPDSASRFILAATENGLFRAADGAKTWKPVKLPPTVQGVRALARLDGAHLAVVTSTGVFFSADGLEWQAASSLPGNAEPYDVVATDSNTLFVASSAGLMRSIDLGNSWETVLGGLQPGTVRTVYKHPSLPKVLFAAQYGDVYESLDDGHSWLKISPEKSGVSVKELAIVPTRSDRLFVLTQRQGVFALPLEAAASGASGTQGISTDAERGKNNE
jgi:photosystem II stability/assembly factor-like uncharacterized protein